MKTASLIFSLNFFLGLSGLTSGCVSIHLGGQNLHRATGFSFTPPSEPFKAVHVEDLDQAWYSPEDKTSISFLTECGDVRRLNLDQLEQGLLRSLEQPRVLASSNVPYQGVTARHSQFTGQLDGQDTYYQARIFIKGDCLYLISHVAPLPATPKKQERQAASTHLPGHTQYEKFLEDFVVP